MPVARYFLFVGGILLALILAIDAFFPQQAVVASYDTSLPTIVPPVVTAQARAIAPAAAAEVVAPANVRDTFAQFVPSEAKKPTPPVKRKIAKSRPMQIGQPQVRVAQQSHYGFFGGSNWNSTW